MEPNTDNSIISLPPSHKDLIDDIMEIGSMGVFMNAKSSKNYKIMNILREHGLNPSLSDKIMHSIKSSEHGDNLRNRFYILIRSISIRAKVECDTEFNYRCVRKFHFDKPYTIYEYDLWIGSFEELGIHKNVTLKCVVKNITKCKDVITQILPLLYYTTKNGMLIIHSVDVCNLLRYT